MVSPISRDSSYSSDSSCTPPSSPSKRASLSDVTNLFVKMRNMKERTKSHHIVSSSGDSPQTHASLQGEGVTSGEQVDMELNDVYSCQGAVDVSRLLRVSRAKLMQQAKYLNGNVLLDEHWQCTIRGPKNRRDGTFRVHIRYAASASRSYLPDPQSPIAIDKARSGSVPGLMTVLPSRR